MRTPATMDVRKRRVKRGERGGGLGGGGGLQLISLDRPEMAESLGLLSE